MHALLQMREWRPLGFKPDGTPCVLSVSHNLVLVASFARRSHLRISGFRREEL